MASLEMALATSHSPMLSTAPELWAARLEGDRMMFEDRWASLVAARGEWLVQELSPQRWADRHANVQTAIDDLAATLADHDIDVVVIVGDDQQEVFPPGTLPPFAVWCADSAVDDPPDSATLPGFRLASKWAFHGDKPTTYPCHPDFAMHLVGRTTADGFDVTTVAEPPPGRHLGHAFTFVQRRLVRDQALPMVPVLLNSFYPRSQPRVRRCQDLGVSLAYAVNTWPTSERVALVASGGLSHHLVDERFDRRLLDALGGASAREVLALSDANFVDGDRPCGTGEAKNWIVVGAAARTAGLTMHVSAYEPLYRTPAGTGVGAAFARWTRG